MTPPTEQREQTGLDIAIRTAGVADIWNRDQVNLMLMEYAAKGTTVTEFTSFLIIAKQLELNPFLHEIWLPDFDGTGRNRAPYVGRDGLLAIAERSGQFDGLVSGVVCEGDEFELGLNEPVHKLAPGERGRILYAYAYVYRKDRRVPTSVVASRATFLDPKVLDEQGKPRTGPVTKTPWFKFPDLMLKKVAEANALRLCFKVSGVVAVADNATPVDETDIVDAEIVADQPARPEDGAGHTSASQKPTPEGPEPGEQPEPDADIPVFPDQDAADEQGRLA
jgi:phage recombination protein Bet